MSARIVLVSWLLIGASAYAQVLRDFDYGVNSGDHFGECCANAGDVDGDGTDDFIVGSPVYDGGTPPASGRVVVYSGATGAVIRSHDGLGAGDMLGASVAGAGDVNGDGFADYVVGAPNHSELLLYVGMVVVYSGKSGDEILSVTGSTLFAGLGSTVSGLGDVDGDGRSDVIVNANNSEVYVLSTNYRYGIMYDLSGTDQFGHAVSGCGDLDGDGVNDFLISAPLHDGGTPVQTDVGAVYAYSGSSGSLIRLVEGTHANDQLGRSLAALGDVDHDGVDDYIAGSGDSDANGTLSGIVRVISGATGATIREQTGDTSFELHGGSVTGMGDVDLDGVPDYAVGAVDAGNGSEGRVRICSGSTGATIHEWYGSSSGNNDLGSSVASGDWNGDGVADLLAGDALGIPRGGTYVGTVALYLMCPAWRTNYGTGWPGRNGIPTLMAVQKPEVGSVLDLQIGSSTVITAPAVLFVGVQSANLALPGSGTLLVTPLFTIPLSVPRTGLTVSSTIPNDPSLYFFDLYLQVLESDSFASKGLSFTPGLQLHCGFDLP